MQIIKGKALKRVISVLSLVACFFVIDWGMGELIEPITYATYFNHDIRTIEDNGAKADVVFIGASRVYRTFIPQIFEDKWKVDCVVNAGSSDQPACGTYYQLKDLIERVHPDRVYIGVTADGLLESDLRGELIVYDRLSWKNRLLLGLNCLDFDEKKYMIDSYRFKKNFDFTKIAKKQKAMKKLRKTGFKADENKEEYYADTGFVYSKSSYETGTIPIERAFRFSRDSIDEQQLHYLDACVDLCKRNNIDVCLLSGVTSVMRMYAVSGYQDAVDFYREYALDKGIDYYNLNYLRDREQLIPDELMHDFNHVNGEGAHVVSEIFADIISEAEAGKDVSHYFYKDFEEFSRDVRRIVAVKATIEADGERDSIRHIHILSLQNDDVKPIYRILVKDTEDGDFMVVQDWTEEDDIDIEVNETSGYTIRVEAGSTDSSLKIASQEYSFK